MQLRSYQQDIFNQLIASKTNDLVQLDTGAGKTPIIAALANHYKKAIVVCHRNILIKQASAMLARAGVRHAVMASKQTRRICGVNNKRLVHNAMIDNDSDVRLISIDTWYSYYKRQHRRAWRTNIVIIDEAHHYADNKWAKLQKAVGARCVGMTATPVRGDGAPLVKGYGGFFDRIVQASELKENGTEKLIAAGYLAQYRTFYADGINVSGRYKLSLVEMPDDIYYRLERGTQAIVVFPRVANARRSLELFSGRGVHAAAIYGAMPDYEIERRLVAFASKQINVLIAVDIINEGFDVPDAEVLILARKCSSFGLFRQLCGRVLRPEEGKIARIYDLNGANISQHGLPSDPVDWNRKQATTLRRDVTVCEKCGLMYKRALEKCPNCGHYNSLHEARGHGAGDITLSRRLAQLKERHRQMLRHELEAAELKKQKADMVAYRATHYLPLSKTWDVSYAGRAAEKLREKLSAELQGMLEPAAYNAFFEKNGHNALTLPFYLLDGKPAAAKEIYEARK